MVNPKSKELLDKMREYIRLSSTIPYKIVCLQHSLMVLYC